jgi:nucleotide-binding universal stress UspA family protein
MATKILVPLNRSDYSHEILPHIEKLIPTSETQLVLFFVTRPPRGMSFAVPDPGSDYALEPGGEPVDPPAHPIYGHQQEDSIQSEVEVHLLPTMGHLQEAGYAVSLQVCFGEDVVGEIVRTVKREKIALVAMSTQARVGMLRFFFSDIADKVMQQVDIPVLRSLI